MVKSFAFLLGVVLGVGHVTAEVVSVSGAIENPNEVHGQGVSYRLVDDTTFGWRTGRITGDLDVAGHTFTMNTGGGNTVHFAGIISGTGTIIWQGGDPGPSQKRPSFFEGNQPNTFSGKLVIQHGRLVLAKPQGVTAIAGPVIMGESNWAGITWQASDQIADDVPITFSGKHLATLDLDRHSETLGTLSLQSNGEIIFGEGANHLTFADSRTMTWQPGCELIVRGWAKEDVLTFGRNGSGLTSKQLAQIGFSNPEGSPPGLYRARKGSGGALVPGQPVRPVDPPYDLSPQAVQRRAKIYESDGLAQLTEAVGGLKGDVTIAFFGDSITWQGGYLRLLQKAVEQNGGAAGKVTLINRGINGGGARHLRDGAGGLFDQKQESLATLLQQDKPDIVVFFIGVNDANWLNTEPDAFRATMVELIDAAKRANATPIVATLMVVGERPDGGNPLDKRLDQFAQITRDVAKRASVATVDLRTISLAYLMNHNCEVRLDGTVQHQTPGFLTHDNIHPTDAGNTLIANHLAAAIAECLKRQK